VSDFSSLALIVIAVSTALMALIQIGALIYGAILARRVNRLADRVEREIDPFMAKVHEMGDQASHATKLAAAQVERADQLTSRLSQRAEETLDVAQQVIITPAREVLALVDGIRAAIARRHENDEPSGGPSAEASSEPPADSRDPSVAPKPGGDKDEALFIG